MDLHPAQTPPICAVDYIASRPDVDLDRVAVWGESQGGGSAFATAALDPRVDFCVADIPFLCDWKNYFKLTHWPEMDEWIAASPNRSWESTLQTLSYFDTMNLADRIHCPTLMGVGLQDQICPPTTNFAAFNRISARKSFRIYKDAGHGLGREHKTWTESILREELVADGNAGVADELPQWLGPGREPIWKATGIVSTFPESGPPLRWKTKIGSGYSGPAVAGGRRWRALSSQQPGYCPPVIHTVGEERHLIIWHGEARQGEQK